MLPHTAIWNGLIAWNKLNVWIRKQPFSNPLFSWFSRGIKRHFNVQVHSGENGSCLGELEWVGEGVFSTAESAWEQPRMCTGWQGWAGEPGWRTVGHHVPWWEKHVESLRRGGEVPGAQSRGPESTSADGGVPRGRPASKASWEGDVWFSV